MKTRTIVLMLALSILGVAVSFAAENPNMGTWKLNEAKSKFSPGAFKNTMVVYEAASDSVKVTTDGTSSDGKTVHTEWTGKFDGKDYPVTGSADTDSREYTQVNANTTTFANKKDGKVTLLGGDRDTPGASPNGITLSPDERYLYLTALQKMMRYEVKPDGSLGPGSLFTQGPGIGDGMKVDTQGNVYSTSGAGPGIVRVTSPTGTLLGYLNLPIVGGEPKRQICATNVAFGDADGKSLYVTACDAVYRIRLKIAGVMPGPKR